MMFKLRSIRLSFLKFLLASNGIFHQSLATAVQLRLMRFMLNINDLHYFLLFMEDAENYFSMKLSKIF